MATVKIAHTAAFQLCEEGTCENETISKDEKKVFCQQGDGCQKGGCYCQLFRRKLDAGDDDPWLVVDLGARHEAKNEPKKWHYKCICVRPILETKHEEKFGRFTVRFQFCDEGMGLCTLERTGGEENKVACTGDCANNKCNCALFQLNMGDDPAKAKWEIASSGNNKISYQPGYYYRCFCLK